MNENSKMNENDIRRVVHEKLNKTYSWTQSENVYSRTQTLIQSAASSVLSNYQNPVQGLKNSAPVTLKDNCRGRFHPYRIKSNFPKRVQKPKRIREREKTYEVVLLDENHLKEGPYRYTDAMVVGTYYIDIFPDDTEKVIRKNLVDLFKKKLPLISENVFEFVKCNRAAISDAEVTEDFNWNYTHIKALVGQGRLYTRLIIPAYTLEYKNDSDSEIHSNDQAANAVHPQGSKNISTHQETEKMLSEQCTSNSLSDVPHTESIVEDFHNLNYATQDDSSLLAACGHSFNSAPSSDYYFSADVSTFVNELLDAKTPEISENFNSLEDSLLCLRKQLNMDDSKRLQIEPDYIFSDAL